jgi:hypothetical protein
MGSLLHEPAGKHRRRDRRRCCKQLFTRVWTRGPRLRIVKTPPSGTLRPPRNDHRSPRRPSGRLRCRHSRRGPPACARAGDVPRVRWAYLGGSSAGLGAPDGTRSSPALVPGLLVGRRRAGRPGMDARPAGGPRLGLRLGKSPVRAGLGVPLQRRGGPYPTTSRVPVRKGPPGRGSGAGRGHADDPTARAAPAHPAPEGAADPRLPLVLRTPERSALLPLEGLTGQSLGMAGLD